MNVFSSAPLYRIINLLKSILSFIVTIFYSKKITTDDNSDDSRHLEIKIGDGSSAHQASAHLGPHVPPVAPLVDWNKWEDEAVNSETINNDQDFFEDMRPTLTRPRILKVATDSELRGKLEMKSRLQVDTTNLEVQSELGTWTDNSAGWDDELNEDLSEEATSILKEKRKLERQIRTNEQKRKKEALRAQRAEKKSVLFLGMKMN